MTESYEEDVSCSPADREENTKDDQIEYKDNEESVSFLSADREEENTEDDKIEYEDNEESVSFSPTDREEEDTEDDQIEYEDNEESVSFSPTDREEENTEDDQIEYGDNEESVSFHMLIEKKRTQKRKQKMTRLNTKAMKKVSCKKWKMTFKSLRLRVGLLHENVHLR